MSKKPTVIALPRDLHSCDPGVVAISSTNLSDATCVVVAEAERGRELDALVAELRDDGVDAEAHVVSDDLASYLLDLARERRASLVVKTARPGDESRYRLFGSVATRLLRESSCPVWIARPTANRQPKRILAAVRLPRVPDAAVLEHQVMSTASELADVTGCELHVVCAWETLSGRRHVRHLAPGELARYVKDQGKRYRDRARRFLEPYRVARERLHVRRGAPIGVIDEVGREIGADIVVAGSAARSGIVAAFASNTVEALLRETDTSIVGVRRTRHPMPAY